MDVFLVLSDQIRHLEQGKERGPVFSECLEHLDGVFVDLISD
jgi:hypothetical protein